ncbi:hypothetical protein Deba_2342 [Desulfarculus baarsii DSM 2075]|uniref:Uncharacterized protein n=1 Tax=Desulfarculus baarsii (strain ATCC 33931 / DSM 2075 / LMG 7858 / VKM B-1802 / 2st14) TaxID=644282 RepID=E1QJG1_DESB2|nr:hypothetical protein [Desulfarculus baarsii]ADK85704.1 hypothetical protein Deba_2342 [Desulfarculus baarsii DSM 2075]
MTPIKIDPAAPAGWTAGEPTRSRADGLAEDKTRSVTSHSLTLRTPLFSLGYSWRRVELEPTPTSGGGRVSPDEKPSGPTVKRQPQKPDTPEEAKRRMQLAALLTKADSPADDFPAAAAPTPGQRPSAEAVCRLYSRHAGPAADDHQGQPPSC